MEEKPVGNQLGESNPSCVTAPETLPETQRGVMAAPWVQGAARQAGLGVCPAPPTSTTRVFFFRIRTTGSTNPAVPAPRSAAGAWQEQAVHARGVEMSLSARFPAKSASAGGRELSSSWEPDSAPQTSVFFRAQIPPTPAHLHRALLPGPEDSPYFNGK